jgi:hypothetical protein
VGGLTSPAEAQGPPGIGDGRRQTLWRVGRGILRGAALLVLLALAWGALDGGVRQIPRSLTLGQRAETGVQLIAGALTLLVVLTTFVGRRWQVPVRAAWAAAVALAAGLSALVWGPPMPVIALLFAGGALLLAWGIHRLLQGDQVFHFHFRQK